MKPEEKSKLFKLVSAVYAFYRQDTSEFALNVWWQAMQPFDHEAVADALNRHCVNPDSGQFMPKPADVVKMLRGSSQDGALVAWSKVDKAVRQVGPYQTVVFDDPVVHRVLQDMGGWAQLGNKPEKEWPFVAKEFENRYRGYHQRNEIPEYPRYLLGICAAENAQNGFQAPAPVLIGNPEKAKQVLIGGSDKPALGFQRLDQNEMALLTAPKETA